MTDIETKIGYSFRDKRLLTTALTHSSYVNEHGLPKSASYERLEFLGDAVLEHISSEFLYRKFPDVPEGELSRYRANLVCEESLSEIAKNLGLPNALLLGRGMENGGGRNHSSVLCDVFESLLAAVCLDGGYENAKKIADEFVLKDAEKKLFSKDPKSILQELVQKNGPAPEYRLLSEEGPDHEKTYRYGVYIGGVLSGEGAGSSKKKAQENAAAQAVESIKNQRDTVCF